MMVGQGLVGLLKGGRLITCRVFPPSSSYFPWRWSRRPSRSRWGPGRGSPCGLKVRWGPPRSLPDYAAVGVVSRVGFGFLDLLVLLGQELGRSVDRMGFFGLILSFRTLWLSSSLILVDQPLIDL